MLYRENMKEAESFPAAVGAYIANTRAVLGLTLDQIAQAARLYGANWSPSSVRNLERGQASLTLPTLIVLALALGRVQGRPISVLELCSTAENLVLTEGDAGIVVSREWLEAVLGNETVTYDLQLSADFDTHEEPAESPHTRAKRLEQQRNMYLVNGRDVPKELSDELFRALDDARKTPPEPVTLAEKRAADKLSITPLELQRYALRLWGRALEAESAFRAGDGSSPQARGRITRVLVDEIRKVVDRDVSRT